MFNIFLSISARKII